MTSQTHDQCLVKQQKLLDFLFLEGFDLYDQLIKLGKQPNYFNQKYQTDDYLVPGCQSNLYLHAAYNSNHLIFSTYTEALISAGLAKLFTESYSNETPETVLTCPPIFFTKLDKLISLGRTSGMTSLHTKMKQIALNTLMCSFNTN